MKENEKRKSRMEKKIERALTQTIRAVPFALNENEHHFKVIGTTKKTYNTIFSAAHVACTCPDFQNRGLPCKHICYLIYHYYHIRKECIISELRAYSLEAFKKKRSTYNLKGNENATFIRPDDCTICHDKIDDTREVVICLKGCHKPLHVDCFQIYKDFQIRMAKLPTCPSCREIMEYDRMRM